MINPRQPNYASTPAAADRPAFDYAPDDPHAAPLVSILTPFFNPGPLFQETACSVFRQSLQQYEWLIINDATPHAAARNLLHEYRQRDPRIRVIDHEINKGLSAARNTGVAAARSPYVFLLDDDDLLEPTALEKMYWFLETHPEFAAVNGWEVGFGASEYLWPLGFDRGAHILKENCTTGRAMVRCAAHRAIGGHDESIRQGMEDWEYWLRLADHGMWGYTIPEYLDWYRRRAQHQQRWENLDGGPRQRAFCEWLRKRYRRLYAGAFPNIRVKPHEAFEDLRPPPAGFNLLAGEKPRLLMLIPRMSLGGAERAALELLRQLACRGWEVTIAALCTGDHTWAPEFARFTPDIFVLPNFLRPPDYPAFLQYLVASRRPEAVLSSGSELGYLLLPYLRSMCPEPAYIDLVHSEAPQWKNGGYARYAAGSQDHVDLTLVTSEHLKRHLVQRSADAARIEVLYLNVDAQRWNRCPETRTRVRAELATAQDDVLILFAGRLNAEKQPRVLAQTLHKLRERHLPFRALLAGDGGERGWLEEFFQQHGLTERVRLLGDVPAEHLCELMAAADIFFLPSLWEGIALTIYEAMACGLAVVGADVGGQRELVTPDCGLLLPKRGESEEVAAYAAALEGLVKDRPRREELGHNARQRIESQFDLPAMAERFFGLLERARRLRARPNRLVLPPAAARESAALAIEFVRVNEALDATWREAQSVWQNYQRLAEQQRRSPGPAATAASAFLDRAGAGNGRAADAEERLRRAEQAGVALCAELNRISAELSGVYNSTGWHLLQVLYRIRFAACPRGSWRERVGKRGMHALRRLRQRFASGFKHTPRTPIAPVASATAANPPAAAASDAPAIEGTAALPEDAAPFSIYADSTAELWLRELRFAPHSLHRWPGDRATPGEPRAILLVSPPALPTLATLDLAKCTPIVVSFDDDPGLPYRYGHLVQHLEAACLAPDERTRDRLEIFTRRVRQATTTAARFTAVLAFARDNQTATDEEARVPAVPGPAPMGDRPVRVLLQVNHYEQGGLEQVVLDLAGALGAAGLVTGILVLGREGFAAGEARRRGLRVLRLPQFQSEAAYRELLGEWDIINAHYSHFGVELAAVAGRPFVQTVHSTYVGLEQSVRAAYRRADAVTAAYTCVSSTAAFYADAGLGLSPQRMLVIPNGIDRELLDAARAATERTTQRQSLGLDKRDFAFLTVGSIYPPKAQHLLIAALQRVRERDQRIKLVILGRVMDEKYACAVREQAERLGVSDAILWLDHQPDPQRLYMTCDAFVLPSFVEGWSLALAEAVYARLPIVATDVGAAHELVDEQRGRLIPPPYRSVLDFDGAESFEAVLGKKHPGLVETLAEAMLAVAGSGPPPPIPPELARRLDRRYAYLGYARVFECLAVGGQAADARPWIWAAQRGDISGAAAAAQRETTAKTGLQEPVVL